MAALGYDSDLSCSTSTLVTAGLGQNTRLTPAVRTPGEAGITGLGKGGSENLMTRSIKEQYY